MRSSAYGVLAFLMLVWPVAAFAAPCGPRTTESNDQMVYATDCAIEHAETTTTGGIQEAIDSCDAGSWTKGCVVILPRGDVPITSTISLGGLDMSTFKAGVTLRGHGSGPVGSTQIPTGGTTIIWDDAASGGAVISVQGSGHRLEDFTVWGDSADNGVNVADTLLEVHALGSAMTSGIIIESLDLYGTRDLGGTRPLGIAVRGKSASGNDQLDRIVVRNSSISHVRGCLEQSSNQAAANLWQQVNCAHFDEYGVNVLGGSISIVESVFSWPQGSDAIAAIRFHSSYSGGVYRGALYENIERCHFEIGSGSAIISTSADGNPQRRAIRIVGNNFVMEYEDPAPNDPGADNDFINLQERGSVAIIGNSFEWTTGSPPFSGVGGDIVVDSSLPSQVFAAANFTRNLVNLDWEVTGAAHLVCNDADAVGVFDDANCNSERDPGEAYFSGASNSNSHGAVRWAISDGLDWNTGGKVCNGAGLDCVEAVSIGPPQTSRICAYPYDADERFLAFCR